MSAFSPLYFEGPGVMSLFRILLSYFHVVFLDFDCCKSGN